MTYSTIADLFQPEPVRWGLRGDPYLWQEMAEHFRQAPLPTDLRDLAQQLVDAFEQLTGQSLSTVGNLHLPRHAHGGMSSGGIATQHWREQLLPLLLSRFRDQFEG
ncbi:MAG: hypothetical protein KDI37_11340 [Xanthomonadales bacterium]|nr:hypothetical protein [Xanthomonadales bacterium]